MTNAVIIAQQGSNNTTFRNRIINGAMVIDQRNAGASVTNTSGGAYILDRWNAFGSQASKFTSQQNAGSVTPPAGFKNYFGITSLSAYTVGASEAFSIRQYIEGYNVFDFGLGASGALTFTISFWVCSSLTGSFGGCLYNNAGDRFYRFSYTISAANTWEQKTVTVVGDTSGTWLTTNGIGLAVQFSIGAGATVSGTAGAWTGSTALQPTGSVSVVGTNGATFYITGVQLEAGSTASPFENRSYGVELGLCQRYYQEACSIVTTTGQYLNHLRLPVVMRVGPTVGTITFDSGTGATFALVTNTGNGTAGLSLYQSANHSVTATATKIPLSSEL
jgi:hypothetical protein